MRALPLPSPSITSVLARMESGLIDRDAWCDQALIDRPVKAIWRLSFEQQYAELEVLVGGGTEQVYDVLDTCCNAWHRQGRSQPTQAIPTKGRCQPRKTAAGERRQAADNAAMTADHHSDRRSPPRHGHARRSRPRPFA